MDSLDLINEKKFNAINEAVCFWLGYQLKIGRERLIHEASLRYPIADTITAGGTKISRIQLEKGHPYFSDRLIDIVVYDEDVESITTDNVVSSLVEIYELKIVKQDTGNKFGVEHQRVIDDVLRLAYLNQKSGKDSYFLICGRYMDFKNYFIGQKKDPKIDAGRVILSENKGDVNGSDDEGWNVEDSLYKKYFDFRFGKTMIFTCEANDALETQSKDERKSLEFGLTSFQSRYKIKDVAFEYESSLKIKTTCMVITPFEKTSFRTHACGIWKIEVTN